MNQSIMNSLMVDKEYKRFFPKSRDAHSVVGFNMKEYELIFSSVVVCLKLRPETTRIA